MITRAQMPRQLRNKGGITNAVPREKYGLGSKIKDRFRKLIPNELADIAVKAAPFVAPFNPGIAGLMRGIGRFDQRGSISDALKQGAATFGFGKAVGFLGGAEGPGGMFGKQTFTKEGFRQGPVGKRLFKEAPLTEDTRFDAVSFDETAADRAAKTTEITGGGSGGGKGLMETATDKIFENIPFGDKLKQKTKEKLLVGGITSGASALYSYFTGEFEPQEPGETLGEYMARRKERVKSQMRQVMDSYYTPLRNPEYAAMSDEQKNNFIDGIVGQTGLEGTTDYQGEAKATGGRVGYQTGGITMANTLAENIRRNLANQAAVAEQFRKARANIPGYVEPQRIAAPKAAPIKIEEPDLPISKPVQPPGGDVQPMLPVMPDQPGLFPQPPKKVIPVEPGPAGIDNLLPDLYEKVIGPAEPPRKIIPEEGTVGPITKLPVEPDPDTPIDELVVPIMPTLPVEPRTDQDLIEGFEKFKQENPEVMQGAGIAAVIQGTLPDGTPITFSGGVESNAFNKYLESLGLSRADIFKPKAMPVKSIGLEKLAKGGMPVGIMRTNKAGVMERDYRDKGGFVPVGIKEKADDVPAMLSKNEFVFTADAVRGAGNGSIEKGAQRMYDTMKNLEKRVV